MNFPLVFSLGRRNHRLPTESFQFVSSIANCVYLSPESHACLFSLAFSQGLLPAVYYGCCQKRSSHLGAVGWVGVGRLGGQLSLQRSDLASGIQTHLRGEAGRLYKLVGKGTMSCALCVPIWSIIVRNRAENMWILLTDWSKSFASSSSRNWFSIFSPSKWTSHWFFCLILFFGFGNHWLFFFFDTFKIFFI